MKTWRSVAPSACLNSMAAGVFPAAKSPSNHVNGSPSPKTAAAASQLPLKMYGQATTNDTFGAAISKQGAESSSAT